MRVCGLDSSYSRWGQQQAFVKMEISLCVSWSAGILDQLRNINLLRKGPTSMNLIIHTVLFLCDGSEFISDCIWLSISNNILCSECIPGLPQKGTVFFLICDNPTVFPIILNSFLWSDIVKHYICIAMFAWQNTGLEHHHPEWKVPGSNQCTQLDLIDMHFGGVVQRVHHNLRSWVSGLLVAEDKEEWLLHEVKHKVVHLHQVVR